MKLQTSKHFSKILVLALLIGTAFGFSLNRVGLEDVTVMNDLQATQAMYVGQAGLEYAKRQLNLGLNGSVTKNFGPGSFTVTVDASAGRVTSLGEVGHAKRVQTIDLVSAANPQQAI